MIKKKFKTVLRYRASRDGWRRVDFHKWIDGKGPTVSLFKIKDNEQCVGGFTSAMWASPQDETNISDSTAMLFNLTTRKLFECKKHEWAIKCGNYGPFFGNYELVASEPFNGTNKCWSLANQDVYRIGIDSQSRSMLTNLKCEKKYGFDECRFTISELEVWEIIFSK